MNTTRVRDSPSAAAPASTASDSTKRRRNRLLVLVSLPFTAAGLWMLAAGLAPSVAAAVNLPWSGRAFYLAVGLLLDGIGFGLLLYASRAWKTVAPEASVAEPWLLRPEWASPEVESGARRRLRRAWSFAALWCLFTVAMGTMIIPESLDGLPPVGWAALLAFPIIGVALLAWAVMLTAGWRRFGPTVLLMDPWPGAIGGQVGGMLAVRVPYDRSVEFRATLTCLYSSMVGGGKGRHREERVVWRSDGVAHSLPWNDRTKLEILFDVDAELPASEPKDGGAYHLWRLRVEGALPGVDFDRSFEIPVFPTGARATHLGELTAGHESAAERREQEMEEVLDIRHILGGVELHYPAFRHPGEKVAKLAFGLVLAAIGALTGGMGAPLILRIALGAMGGAIVLSSVYLLLRSLRVRLDDARVETRRYVLGARVGGRTVPRDSIRDLSSKRSYRVSNGKTQTEFFELRARTRDGRAVTIGYNLAGRDIANHALRSLSRLTGIPVADA